MRPGWKKGTKITFSEKGVRGGGQVLGPYPARAGYAPGGHPAGGLTSAAGCVARVREAAQRLQLCCAGVLLTRGLVWERRPSRTFPTLRPALPSGDEDAGRIPAEMILCAALCPSPPTLPTLHAPRTLPLPQVMRTRGASPPT